MIFNSVSELPPAFDVENVARRELPQAVLMAPPDFFEVRDVKNEFMRNNVGNVDRPAARSQWEHIKATFERCGIATHVLNPLPGCEDMVFTANPSFTGRDANGTAVCVPGRMAFTSRRPEAAAHAQWCAAHGYEVRELPRDVERFEGTGDSLWHPGRALIWAGEGARTERRAHEALADIFGVPVIRLKLADPRFYHLDTCFCALSDRCVLIYPKAFTTEGLALIHRVFPDVVEVDEAEATGAFSCNAAAFNGKTVVIQHGAPRTNAELRRRGFDVQEVATDEFLKSGGSVFCLKAALY